MTTGDIHSMVIASDYRVPDPARVWPLLERRKAALADIGAHHVLVYTSTHDYGRVLVMIGVLAVMGWCEGGESSWMTLPAAWRTAGLHLRAACGGAMLAVSVTWLINWNKS